MSSLYYRILVNSSLYVVLILQNYYMSSLYYRIFEFADKPNVLKISRKIKNYKIDILIHSLNILQFQI